MKLDRPTIAELVAHLLTFPMHTPVRIIDADTGWTIHQIYVEMRDDAIFLSGDYTEMNDEEQLPPKT